MRSRLHMNRTFSYALTVSVVGACAGASSGCGFLNGLKKAATDFVSPDQPEKANLGTDPRDFVVTTLEESAMRELREEFTALYTGMFVGGGVWPIDANVPEYAPERSRPIRKQRAPIVGSGHGVVEAQDKVRLAAWCDGFEDFAQVQANEYHCWAACASMVLRYTEGSAVSQDELIRAVKGEVFETGGDADDPRNMGNAYEVAKALNHRLINESDEFLVVTRAAMELAMTEDEGDLLTAEKSRLVRRFLEQYMSAGEIVSAVASGEPVVVGLWNTDNDEPSAARLDSGHAMVIHRIEFSYVKRKGSADMRLAQLRLLTEYLEAYANRGPGEAEDRELWGNEAAKALALYKRFGEVRSDFPTAVSIDKVHLVDPYDYSAEPDRQRLRTVIDGDELGRRMFFALSKPKAAAITPFEDGSDRDE